MVSTEITGIDPLELYKKLKPADNYHIFACSPIVKIICILNGSVSEETERVCRVIQQSF